MFVVVINGIWRWAMGCLWKPNVSPGWCGICVSFVFSPFHLRISVFLTVLWKDDCSQTEKDKEKTCFVIRPALYWCYNSWNGAQVHKFQFHFWSGLHQGVGEWYQEVLAYVTIFEGGYSFRFVNCFLLAFLLDSL